MMTPLRVSVVVAALTAVVAFSGVANARCVLPVPDGGGEPPSPASVEGDIVSIKGDVVVVRSLRTKKEVPVRVPMNKPIYSAFGGDDDPRELRPGQRAWVWFVDCRRGTMAIPESAYFQIYSKDPNDRP
jgi:hypothetical protein